MSYKIKLDSFEGPLDLLLFLIKKEEVDIYDIPIAKITQQFLEYIEIIQLLDLESASDFILMAATLMRIKAQMLLPKPAIAEEEEEIGDPRQVLVQRLLEYKRFKDVALDLGDKEEINAKLFPRGKIKIEDESIGEEYLAASEVSLFDLVAAFKQVIEQGQKPALVHQIQDINVTLEERMDFISRKLFDQIEIRFAQLFAAHEDRIIWVVTFIALLELIHRRHVQVFQEKPFSEIMIRKADE
jgi:segregation and condensation protein A